MLLKLLQFTRHYYTDKVNSDPSTADALRVYLREDAADGQPPRAEILLSRLEKYRSTIPLTADSVRLYLEPYGDKVVLVRNDADRERLIARLTQRLQTQGEGHDD